MNLNSNDNQQDSVPECSFRTLIVEDHVGSAKILAILFDKLGQQQVELAHSGRDAIEKANDFRPQIIILDLVLGDMSGLEVAKTLRQLQNFRDTLIVALSGNATAEHRQQTKEAGFDLHLEKPVGVGNIQDIIRFAKKQTEQDQ